ncbi:MAG: tripartite tricarboxylate transporter substrate binding protein [Thermodesulfobacteriota bacterium]
MRSTLMALLLCVVLAGLCVAQPVFAADYPNRPIKMLTMVKPGAQIDLLTRAMAEAMKDQLGQPVLVSNNPGGSHGSVMASELSAAKPDGYTLGVSATAAFTYSPHFVETRYKLDDFAFVSLLGLNQSGLVCAPNRPWKNLKDAFEWARKEKKGLTYMFQGSDDRDAMKRIAAKEGVNLALMPSTGGPSIISAVMGGHADLGHLGAILFEYVKAGKLTLLAASTPERLTPIPDVPTLREQGWDESVEMFVVLAAPKGLPGDIMAKLEKVMDTLSKDEKFRNFITGDLKMGPVTFGSEHAKTYMKKASERFALEAAEAKKTK